MIVKSFLTTKNHLLFNIVKMSLESGDDGGKEVSMVFRI
jgi:hypothetical protein